MSNTYQIACTQVIGILRNLPKKQYDMIPLEVIKYYEANIDKNYKFKIGEELSKQSRIIMITLIKKYFLNDIENELLDESLIRNSNIIENEKKEKYDVDKIFNKNKTYKTLGNDIGKEMIEYKETIISKIVKFFKNIFKL